jgi:lipoic acid synthetase
MTTLPPDFAEMAPPAALPTPISPTTAAETPPDSAAPVRRMLRVEARNSQVPIERKPEWIRTKLHTGPEFKKLQGLVRQEGLHTVCQEAGCPNIYECWEDREATFLIGGDTCTRRCDFCLIKTGRPGTFDADEPRRVGESVAKMQLKYATVTGVTRDDLADEGAWLYAATVRQIHAQSPGTGVEILTPDFSCKADLLQKVFDTEPAVFAHNIETVPRIFKRIRPAFTYDGSLAVLRMAKDAGMVTKSNLILGMGETREEITQALEDLRSVDCDLLTVTQYLRPTPKHHPIDRWVKPREFVDIRKEALSIGFVGVMSGPLVRSSYRAGTLYRQAMEARVGSDN